MLFNQLLDDANIYLSKGIMQHIVVYIF